MKSKNILFTGSPGCGKTTLIESIIQRLQRPARGFFTRELRECGRRTGFSISTLDGREGLLAHINVQSLFRVGKYGVNIDDINRIVVPSITPKTPDEVVIIDEIGKMECFSSLFRATLITVLDLNNMVIGSISFKGNRFIEGIKLRPDVSIVQVTQHNRDKLVDDFYSFL